MIEFRILGPLEVVRDGRSISLGRHRQLGVLALLVLRAGEVVSTDRLIDEFWGDEASDSALNALQATISRLRRLLADEDLLVTRQPGYVLELGPDQLDLWRFERLVEEGERLLGEGDPDTASTALRTALAVWRGPALANLNTHPFAQVEIARLEGARLVALELRIDADLERGRHALLVGELEALVGEYPLREGFRGRLMVALYRSGRQADALRVYREARGLLVEELGIEPSRGLQELERSILAQDASLELPASRAAPAVAVAEAPARDGPAAPRPDADATPGRTRPRRRAWLLAGAVPLVVLGVTLPLVLGGGGKSVMLGADSIGRFDLRSGRLVRSIPAGARPSAVAAGFRSVWVANAGAGTVTRVDPATGAAQDTIQVGASPVAIAIGAGSVWVANSGGDTVSRVSPETDVVLRTVRVGNGPADIAVGGGSVWVANSLDGTVTRLSASTAKRLATIVLGGDPVAVEAGGGSVWVADEENGSVEQVDPVAGVVIGRTQVGTDPRALAVGAGSVWVANTLDGTVSRIDAGTAKVRAVVSVDSGPVGISAGSTGVWVASSDGTLSRLDPRTAQVAARVRVGASPSAVAGTRCALWLTALASDSQHRGGTLRVAVANLPSPDPTNYDFDSYRLLSNVYDGLVAYRHVDGAAGAEIVPDLAEAVSPPTARGTSYSFRLRAGIRFSNGEPVRARDVRVSLERSIRRGNPLLGSIVGADRCTPAKCDLTRGVLTDDHAGVVTIRLRRPDPDLLQALALPLSAVVPADSPFEVGPGRLLPGTGPYRVARYVPGSRLVLVRSRRFRVFAPEAQPDGYPDRIVAVPADADTVRNVERGRLDWVAVPPAAAVGALVNRFSGELHAGPTPGIVFPFLNPRLAPFDDLRVRRAVNLAVDRRVVARLEGGSLFAEPTCQELPPDIPGYRPYCPYTKGSNAAGAWIAPDPARAKELVAASGTRGEKVAVWTDRQPFRLDVGRYLVRVLDGLGYRASLRVPSDYFPAIEHGRPQIGWYGWNLDYPSPLDLLAHNFECGSGLNPGASCSHALVAQISQAARDSAAGVAGAPAEWGAIDRELVDRAVMLPLVSLRSAVLVSRRVGNVVTNPQYGTLLDQLWVR